MIKTRNPIKPMVIKEKSYTGHILAVMALWILAMSFDYHDEELSRLQMERNAAHQAAEVYEERIKALEACEAKRISGYYYQDRAFVCPQEV